MRTTRIVTTDAMRPGLLAAARDLLDRAFDGGFTDADWEHTLGGWHALVLQGEELLAHAAVVPRTLEVGGRRVDSGYVEGVAAAPDRQGAGLGSIAMTTLMDEIRTRFSMGALSTERHGFYRRLGWEPWQGPTYVRTESGLQRTPDEDEGILVLRFGPSRELDLGAAIVCDERCGDDW